MSALVARWLYQDLALLVASTYSASSSDTAQPVIWLKDPLRSKRWKSKAGWNVDAGFNDAIDFNDGGGEENATITAGNYPTGALRAAAVQTAMQALTSDIITVTYDSTTFKFTIASSGGTFSLLWNSGANAVTSCGLDMGFAVAADDTGSSSYLADNVNYKSREWIKSTLPQAHDIQAVIIHWHTVISTGSVTVQANATDVWTSPSIDQVMTYSAELIAFHWGSAQTFRYWRFVIDDTQNPVESVEVGIAYVGIYTQPESGYSHNFAEDRTESSEVSFADQGASYQHEKATRDLFDVSWSHLNASDKADFESILDLVKVGRPFFFNFDNTDVTDTKYVFLGKGGRFQFIAPSSWRIATPLAEAIG